MEERNMDISMRADQDEEVGAFSPETKNAGINAEKR
ncbi:hypothetical protein M493_03440 [Geobacillus genomosp. 3]|uniref:Uncharacterized protein n=1 Tax=Geobacillus genomosp. 3 TaxID=1921421 RepID=S5ZA25_GEOG3|nr:hypothetical protein M493_03440 [Geobacillus genomosp. 3]